MVELLELKRLIKDKPREKELNRAIIHEQRLRFHTETVLEKSELSNYYDTYINWLANNKPEMLPKDKVARFNQLLTVPLSTIELTESIETSLGRVFDAQDAFLRYDCKKDATSAAWVNVRDDEFWRTEGMKAMMAAIDSVWVVEFKEDVATNLLIDVSDVIDILTDARGICEHLIFEKHDKVYVYDDSVIDTYQMVDGEIGEEPINPFHTN